MDFLVVPKLCRVMLALFVLSGCSGVSAELSDEKSQTSLPIAYDVFNTKSYVLETENQIFSLNEEQQQKFLEYYQKAIARGVPANQVISNYLLDKLSNFTYYGHTYTASDAMTYQRGNCMSLAILTTALARLVGIESAYREVLTLPVFEKKNGLLLSSRHVQTKLFSDSNDQQVNSIVARSGIIIDYFPNKTNVNSRYLTSSQFVAMYYQNIASDALVDGDIDKAFAYAMRAFEYDNQSTEAMNLLAVIHRYKGAVSVAEKIYQHAMAQAPDSISLLSNYMVLLNRQGRVKEANALNEVLAKLDDPNPYRWLEQAYLAQHQADYQRAARYFHRTIELAPYVTQAYVGLYQVYMAKGNEARAKQSLASALAWTHEQGERKQLKYKLYGANGFLSTSH